MHLLRVIHLTCEYLTEPLGLDEPRPRFGWQLQSSSRGTMQSAYRLQVFMEDDEIPLFDTGKVSSRACTSVEYAGPSLRPRTRYRYRVRVWDTRGRDSGFSDMASWETGLMSVENIAARWITTQVPDDHTQMNPPMRLRRAFAVREGLTRVRLYASALGVYSLAINGRPVSDDLLAPGFTSYFGRIQYQTYDVTELLRPGENVASAAVADGWYRGFLAFKGNRCVFGQRTALMMQLHVTYQDGTEETIITDTSWRTDRDGPIRFADIYMGTRYDARIDDTAWRLPGFDDFAWPRAAILYHTRATLVGQRDQSVRRVMTIKPSSIITTPRGETVIDMGQNMVGFVRFAVSGPAGSEVSIDHAEVLDAEGNFYRDNYRNAESRLTYLLRGEGVERYEPEFTFFGFRYIRLNNWPCPVKHSDFTGVVIHSDVAVRAGFECSDERVNQLMQNIFWGQRGNFVDVPTDCPQRDERLGWTGDCQVFARTAMTLMDVGPMLSEWLKDLSADQRSDGAVPFVVPHVLTPEAYGSAAWGDAATVVPWTIYQTTGDLRTLRQQFPGMKAWLNFISSQAQDYLWTGGFHFGDWLGLDAREGDYVGATDKSLIATAFYAHSADLTARAAGALGLEKDMQAYKALYQNIVRAFRREFITPAGRLAVRTQTAYVLTLQFDLAEEAHRSRLVHDLTELITASGDHLTTGFVGTPYLCPVLTAGDAHDVAGKLFLRSEYPSWLYPITKGATTIWEHWDGIKPDGSFWSADMNSFNHYAYGAIAEWMMRALAGIDMVKPAYAELLLHPRPIEGLSFVSAWQHTPYGTVRISWRVGGGSREVGCAVPAGVTALMVLEHAQLSAVTESGKPLGDAQGIKRAWQSDDDVMMALQSGEYAFQWPDGT